MSKSKKKRNKKYTGVDAKSNDDVVRVHKVNAVVRSPFKQWLHEHKKLVRRVAIAAVVVALVAFLIVQAIMAIGG
jgi:negative regulator of sigma E activity